MIFTCNFAHWQKIPGRIFPISIARYAPKGWTGASYPKLYPPADLIKHYKNEVINDAEYTTLYRKMVLSHLKQYEVVEEIYGMYTTRIVAEIKYSACALLCYERSNRFCHRHIVRDWLAEDDFYSLEFAVNPQPKAIKPLQFAEKL